MVDTPTKQEELIERLRARLAHEASRRNGAYDHYGIHNTPQSVDPDVFEAIERLSALQQPDERDEVIARLREALGSDWTAADEQISARLTAQVNIWQTMEGLGYQPTPDAVKAIRAAAFAALEAVFARTALGLGDGRPCTEPPADAS